MARKPRDHKAEYQRRKEIAAKAGLPSVRKYKATRKTLALPRAQSFSIKSVRRAGVVWSANHSRVANSRYRRHFTDDEAIAYYRAFVIKGGNNNEKLNRLHDYLVGKGLITEDEWLANYLRE
jgi:hypothetical protein